MTATEEKARQDVTVFESGNQTYTLRDVIDGALFRGELGPIWADFLRGVEAEKKAHQDDLEIEGDALDEAADAFRYQHDLITAEETEKWLSARGLDMNDFGDFFSRRYWARTVRIDLPDQAYPGAGKELKELFAAHLLFSDELERIATQLGWRVAVRRAEEEVDPAAVARAREEFLERHGLREEEVEAWLGQIDREKAWLDHALEAEAAYRARSGSLVNPQARAEELSSLRLPLTRFELEVIQFDSLDAANEALLCVREDGMTMKEVADEGGYPYRQSQVVLENVNEDWQQKYLSVSPGAVLGPIEQGDVFEIGRVTSKIEPSLEDEMVSGRVQQAILQRHFDELCGVHIQWRLFYQMIEE